MVVVCPKCHKPVELDEDLRHYIASIRRVGCDECLRKMAFAETEVVYQPSKVAA